MSDVKENDALIFACCGAADVGELSDLAARKVHKDGVGKFFCLSGIGAGIDMFIDKTKVAPQVVAIDGCPVDCTKKLLEKYEIQKFDYIRVTDLGFEKGQTPITPESTEQVAIKIRNVLSKE